MAHGSNLLLNGVSGKLGIYSVYPHNGKTRIRHCGAFVRNDNDRQIQYQGTVRDLAAAWRQTPIKTKAMWGKLAARMPRWDAQTAQTPLTGYQAFQSVAWGLRALEKGIPEVPLSVPDLPQALPDVVLTATVTNNALRLSVGGGPFPDACQIFACKPAVPGTACKNTWSQITVVQNWDSDAVEIGSEYAAHFGLPEDGAELWLKFVPISQNGFRGQPLVRSVEVVEVTVSVAAFAERSKTPTPAFAKPHATPPEAEGGLTVSCESDVKPARGELASPPAAGGVARSEERTERRGGCSSLPAPPDG